MLIDTNLNFDDFYCYHSSPVEFEKPSYNEIKKVRDNRTTHDNSLLGLWASTVPNMYKSLGGNFIYKINFKNAKIKMIKYSDFVHKCRQVGIDSSFIDYRNELIENNTDVLIVIDKEHKGWYRLSEIIIVNFDSIYTFEKISDKIVDQEFYFKDDGENHVDFRSKPR